LPTLKLAPPAFPPKKRAMLSIEFGSSAAASPPLPLRSDPWVGAVFFALEVIHEATKGFDEELFALAPYTLDPLPLALAEARGDSWLSSS